MLKVALTHDVDRIHKTYQYLTHLIKATLRQSDNALYHISSLFGKNPYWNFDEIVKIENEYNVKSTFFFLNESIKFNLFSISNWKLSLGRYDIKAEKIRHIIQWLDQNGWEIGLHGSYNSFKDLELLEKEKNVLEEIVGHEIIGIRQHYLNLNDSTWELQKNTGFKYDSSWGYTDDIGFKDNKYLPFYPFKNEFVVYPLVLMDACFMNTIDKWKRFNELLDLCEKKESILVINFHQRIFNVNEFPGYETAYLKIIETCNNRDARFCNLSEIYSGLK